MITNDLCRLGIGLPAQRLGMLLGFGTTGFFLNSIQGGSVLEGTKKCQGALMWLFQGHGDEYVQH